jgi:hypothetical protein
MNIRSTHLRAATQAPQTQSPSQLPSPDQSVDNDRFTFSSVSSAGKTILAGAAGGAILGGAGYMLGGLGGAWGRAAGIVGGAAAGGALLGTAALLATAESYQQEAVLFGAVAGGAGAIAAGIAGGMLGSGDLSIAGAVVGGVTGLAGGAIAAQIRS